MRGMVGHQQEGEHGRGDWMMNVWWSIIIIIISNAGEGQWERKYGFTLFTMESHKGLSETEGDEGREWNTHIGSHKKSDKEEETISSW